MATESPSGQTVLVVEDDDSTRLEFAGALREQGYVVTTAANGREALDYLGTHPPPDLIIIAMLMRVMDGWTFLKHREAARPRVPVVITAALSIASDEWAASLGACGWLQKPIALPVLLERVRKCLRSRGP
jgi:CheY-like chemotaxis protein